MRIKPSATALRFLLLTWGILTIAACNDMAASIRQVTYPPDFKYVSTEELRTRMHRLGNQLRQLDDALVTDGLRQPDQQKVVAILREIQQIGNSLQAGDAGASHPFLGDAMNNFVTDVGQARIAASQYPPRYYLAGRVSGACMSCHRVNRY
jgi:hypothetical protein